MGNYLSCTLPKPPGSKCARVRVILPDGGVRQLPLPATAAEVMMDVPGHFLVDARPCGALSLGSRLAALPADAELQLGAVYAAFPMKRAGTPLAPADVARLAAREAQRRSSSSSSAKVASAVVVAEVAKDVSPRLRLEELLDDAAAAEVVELKHRASNARSRRPTLETIEEESYMSSRYVAC